MMASTSGDGLRRPFAPFPVLAAGAVLLVAAGTWGLFGSLPTDPRRPASPTVPYVPSTFEPVPQYVTVPGAAVELANCLPGQLQLETASTPTGPPPDASLGESAYYFQFTNKGGPCALSGGPEVALVSVVGAAVPLTARKVDETASAAGGRTLAELAKRWEVEEGQRVDLTLIVSGSHCGHFQNETIDVVITDGYIGVTTVELPEPNCDPGGIAGDILDSTLWTPHFPDTAGANDPAPLAGSGITVMLEAPETVPVGADMVFAVTLSNPTDRAVSLDPCPQYHQVAGESATVAEEYGVLNCQAAPSAIAANGEVVFEMRLDLPPEFAAGFQGSLFWEVYPAALGDSTTFTVEG